MFNFISERSITFSSDIVASYITSKTNIHHPLVVSSPKQHSLFEGAWRQNCATFGIFKLIKLENITLLKCFVVNDKPWDACQQLILSLQSRWGKGVVSEGFPQLLGKIRELRLVLTCPHSLFDYLQITRISNNSLLLLLQIAQIMNCSKKQKQKNTPCDKTT